MCTEVKRQATFTWEKGGNFQEGRYRECYAHIVTHPAHWLGPEACSFDLLWPLSRQQFKNSSQDTLHRRAMLSFCFTYARSAYIFFFYSGCVCRCGDFSQITVYIHIWLFVVLPLHVIAHLSWHYGCAKCCISDNYLWNVCMFVCFLPQGYNAMSMDIPDKLTNHFNYLSEERDYHVLLLRGISDSLKYYMDDEAIFQSSTSGWHH